ncbi:MAG: trigger factor [Acidimicrobiia bacterium]|nr:trigger factor [Acidimicrobiia bacterium]
MKTELTDVTETQKTITIEIPSDVVDAEIDRIARGYTKQAKLPGFRPGKVPQTVIKQRFRNEIMHDVMHGLIPRAIEEALQERGIEPVDTPNIKDVALEEGQPLRFTAAIETVPPFDPGDLSSVTLRPAKAEVTEEMVDETMKHLRERAAKYETVDSRPVSESDTALVDLHRTMPGRELEHHHDISVDMTSPANPPGFAANLVGMNIGEEKTFTIHFPASYPSPELADKEVTYSVTLKSLHTKTLPELDDEFAKDVGDFESLAALRDRVRSDMQAEAEEKGRRQVRTDLLRQLSQRIAFDLPASLVDREMDRRLEEFARQLMSQNVDPRHAGIDWAEFREAQREPARSAVASALVLDEVARREQITVTPEDVDKEIEQFAARAGKAPAALRAQLEKEGGISRLYAGLRREKAVDLAMSRAKMTSD